VRDAYAELKAAEGGPALAPIIYSSRTHSQLAQVITELKRCGYKCAASRRWLPDRGASQPPDSVGGWGGDMDAMATWKPSNMHDNVASVSPRLFSMNEMGEFCLDCMRCRRNPLAA
jgi:hypothetical protein